MWHHAGRLHYVRKRLDCHEMASCPRTLVGASTASHVAIIHAMRSRLIGARLSAVAWRWQKMHSICLLRCLDAVCKRLRQARAEHGEQGAEWEHGENDRAGHIRDCKHCRRSGRGDLGEAAGSLASIRARMRCRPTSHAVSLIRHSDAPLRTLQAGIRWIAAL